MQGLYPLSSSPLSGFDFPPVPSFPLIIAPDLVDQYALRRPQNSNTYFAPPLPPPAPFVPPLAVEADVERQPFGDRSGTIALPVFFTSAAPLPTVIAPDRTDRPSLTAALAWSSATPLVPPETPLPSVIAPDHTDRPSLTAALAWSSATPTVPPETPLLVMLTVTPDRAVELPRFVLVGDFTANILPIPTPPPPPPPAPAFPPQTPPPIVAPGPIIGGASGGVTWVSMPKSPGEEGELKPFTELDMVPLQKLFTKLSPPDPKKVAFGEVEPQPVYDLQRLFVEAEKKAFAEDTMARVDALEKRLAAALEGAMRDKVTGALATLREEAERRAAMAESERKVAALEADLQTSIERIRALEEESELVRVAGALDVHKREAERRAAILETQDTVAELKVELEAHKERIRELEHDADLARVTGAIGLLREEADRRAADDETERALVALEGDAGLAYLDAEIAAAAERVAELEDREAEYARMDAEIAATEEHIAWLELQASAQRLEALEREASFERMDAEIRATEERIARLEQDFDGMLGEEPPPDTGWPWYAYVAVGTGFIGLALVLHHATRDEPIKTATPKPRKRRRRRGRMKP